MASSTVRSFERAFPGRALFRGQALRALLWSVAASVLLILLLVNFFLLVDLLATGGRATSHGDLAELSELARPGVEPENEAALLPRSHDDTGILPTVWWSRDRFWGPALRELYQAVPVLRTNSLALATLIISAVLLGILRGLCLARAKRLGARASLDVVQRLRNSLHRHALRLGPSDLSDSESQLAFNLFTEESQRLRDGIEIWIERIGRQPLTLLLLIVFSLAVHWVVALQCVIPLGFCWYAIYQERLRIRNVLERTRSESQAALRGLAESFQISRLVTGYGMESFEHEQFEERLNRYLQMDAAIRRNRSWSIWATRLLVASVTGVVVYLIGIRVLSAPHELSFSAALLLIATFACMHKPLYDLVRLPADRAAASLAADRIYRYLNRTPEVSQAVGAKFLQPVARTVHFESLTYTAPNGRKLLDRLDLRVSAGECSAIVATDPLEARTLLYLLPRFIEPQSGRTLFDGEDIAWVTLESLRAETIYVGANDPFFTGTVADNIRCGEKKYTLQDITDAAKMAHAHNFILKLPQGYETQLGEKGEELDPGQAFRLGLARAILRKPALLLIEEPAAVLDEGTKSLLDDAYNRICRDRTVFFLPSRLSTIRRADQVVLLHNGRVEAMGPYSKIIKSSPLFRHWEYIHFNEFRQTDEVPA